MKKLLALLLTLSLTLTLCACGPEDPDGDMPAPGTPEEPEASVPPETPDVPVTPVLDVEICWPVPFDSAPAVESVEIIEDLVTLCDIKVSLDLPTAVTSATLRPSGKTVPVTYEDGRAIFTLDRLHCSEIVELS